MHKVLILFLVSVSFLTVSCSNKFTEININTNKSKYLRDYADDHSLYVGSLYNAYYARDAEDNVSYSALLAKEFNMMSPEWSFAMEEVLTNEGAYNFRYITFALDFAKSNNISIRGTHLLWYSTIPDWLIEGDYTSAEIEKILKDYIYNVMTFCKTNAPGVVKWWNVVNEVIKPDGSGLREGFFLSNIGEDFVNKAFRWAAEANTDADLYINDYAILGNSNDNWSKAKKLFDISKSLKDAGVKIDGVGFQTHISIDETHDFAYYSNVIEMFENIGLDFQITELDILINDNEEGITSEKLIRQANLYKSIFSICLSKRSCDGINLWGLVDKYSYVNSGHASWLSQDEDWPLIFFSDYSAKPAYDSILTLLK